MVVLPHITQHSFCTPIWGLNPQVSDLLLVWNDDQGILG